MFSPELKWQKNYSRVCVSSVWSFCGVHILTVASSDTDANMLGNTGFQCTQFTVRLCPSSTATGSSRFMCHIWTLWSIHIQTYIVTNHINWQHTAKTNPNPSPNPLRPRNTWTALYGPGISEHTLLTLHEPRNKAFCNPAKSPVDRYGYVASL